MEHRIPSDPGAADAPKYVALSYVWGDQTFNVPAEDAAEFSFSVSAALGHVLYGVTEAGSPWIWIDQFCVNQRNVKEKEQQVSTMWRIYANAEKVIGWLGPAFEGSETVFDDLIVFSGAEETDQATQEQLLRIVRSLFGEQASSHDMLSSILSYIGQVVLLGSGLRSRMIHFFSLPWFGRRWIAQEACLASNLHIHCGLRSISGRQLFRAIAGIQSILVYSASPWLQRPFRNAFALLRTRDLVLNAADDHCELSFAHHLHS